MSKKSYKVVTPENEINADFEKESLAYEFLASMMIKTKYNYFFVLEVSEEETENGVVRFAKKIFSVKRGD